MDKRNTYSNIILIIKKIYILKRQSILGFNIPPLQATHRHFTVACAQGVRNFKLT